MSDEQYEDKMFISTEHEGSRWEVYANDGEGHRGHALTIDTDNNQYIQHPFRTYQSSMGNWGDPKGPMDFACTLSDDGIKRMVQTFEKSAEGPLPPEAVDFDQFSFQLGFITDPHLGLGVKNRYRSYFNMLGMITNATTVSFDDEENLNRPDEHVWFVSATELEHDFREMDRVRQRGRRAINSVLQYKVENIIRQAVREEPAQPPQGRSEDTQYIIDNANDVLSPALQKNMIAKLTDTITSTTVRRRDIPKLREKLDLIGFDELIRRIETGINANHKEAYWQRVFQENQYMLQLATNCPTIRFNGQEILHEQGQSGLANSRRPDFVSDNSITRAAVLIEIKTPSTRLLSARKYRSEVFSPVQGLIGAVVQIQEQAEYLARAINLQNNEHTAVSIERTSHNISKVIITGNTKEFEGEECEIKKKSFEQFRSACANVTIITYDELLDKLRQLRSFLEPHIEQNQTHLNLQ